MRSEYDLHSCKICGEFKTYLPGGICMRCARSQYTLARGIEFARETAPAYFEYRFDLEIKGHPREKELTALCDRLAFGERMFQSKEQQRYEEDSLRDYCMECSEEWANFLKENEHNGK